TATTARSTRATKAAATTTGASAWARRINLTLRRHIRCARNAHVEHRAATEVDGDLVDRESVHDRARHIVDDIAQDCPTIDETWRANVLHARKLRQAGTRGRICEDRRRAPFGDDRSTILHEVIEQLHAGLPEATARIVGRIGITKRGVFGRAL